MCERDRYRISHIGRYPKMTDIYDIDRNIHSYKSQFHFGYGICSKIDQY